MDRDFIPLLREAIDLGTEPEVLERYLLSRLGPSQPSILSKRDELLLSIPMTSTQGGVYHLHRLVSGIQLGIKWEVLYTDYQSGLLARMDAFNLIKDMGGAVSVEYSNGLGSRGIDSLFYSKEGKVFIAVPVYNKRGEVKFMEQEIISPIDKGTKDIDIISQTELNRNLRGGAK